MYVCARVRVCVYVCVCFHVRKFVRVYVRTCACVIVDMCKSAPLSTRIYLSI